MSDTDPRSLPPQALTAYYAAADVMLVTPLIDGMNLVAKEYVAVQHSRGCAGTLHVNAPGRPVGGPVSASRRADP